MSINIWSKLHNAVIPNGYGGMSEPTLNPSYSLYTDYQLIDVIIKTIFICMHYYKFTILCG